MSPDDHKRAVGVAVEALVQDHTVVGLGTGTTAVFFVQALAERRLSITCVATSEATANLAKSLGIEVVDLDSVQAIDLTIDGADEIGPHLALIKGGGAALLREKLVWEASRRCIAIADAGKKSERLGRFALPIEVIAFGHLSTAKRIVSALVHEGIEAAPILRMNGASPVRTDGGNVIYDVACGAISDPPRLGAALKAITGVVEHGLFLGLASEALLGTDAGVQTLLP